MPSAWRRILVRSLGLAWLVVQGFAGPTHAAEPGISAGEDFSIVLKADGSLWGWGANINNQLNDGTGETTSIPVRVLDIATANSIASGASHTLAVAPDSDMWAWGSNFAGALGGGHAWYPPNGQFRMVHVESVAAIKQVAGGDGYSLALSLKGSVRAWGRNSYGQLGDGTTDDRLYPVNVGGLIDAVAIAAGADHALAVLANGTVWAWGRNSFGQLGDGTNANRSIPVQVVNLANVVAVSAGEWFSLALDSDGTVWAWGYNGLGQLGDGTTVDRTSPVRVGTLSDIRAIDAGGAHGLARDSTGRVWSWGFNDYGQLGNGGISSTSTPEVIATLPAAVAIAAGDRHSVAIDTIGRVWQWGAVWISSNTSTNRTAPELVSGADGRATLNVLEPSPPIPPEPSVAAWPQDAPVDVFPSDQLAIDVVADAVGGTYVGFYDGATAAVWVQHLDPRAGNLWTSALPLAPAPALEPRFAPDGFGGVLAAWVDGRNGQFCNPTFQGDCDIYAQRIDANGNPLWVDGGVPVAVADGNQRNVAIVGDGSGGAIVVWEDARPPACCRLFAQRIDALGNAVLPLNGIPVSPEVTLSVGTIGSQPLLVSDGSGGAILAWINNQVEPSQLTLQRIGAGGQLSWGAPGIEVGQPSHLSFYKLILDESGGAIVAYSRSEGMVGAPWTDIVAQRVSENGNLAWGPGGILVSGAPRAQINPQMVGDGAGGAIIAWMHEPDSDDGDCFRLTGECDIFAQRVAAAGIAQWQAGGVPISTAPHSQHSPFMVADGFGGAVIVWQDCRRYPARDPCSTSLDVYAQRLTALGETYWAADGAPLTEALGNQGEAPGTPMFSVLRGAADRAGGIVFAWPDGRRTFCAPFYLGSNCDVFAQRVLLGVDTDQDGVTDPIDADDDGDGMPDSFEITNGLNPLDASDAGLDADNDGLTNLGEFQRGTGVHDADSDGDGVADGVEVARGRNPTVNEGAVLQGVNELLLD